MNRKRLGQLLIGGVFAVCGLVIAALAELVAKEEKKSADEEAAQNDQNDEREADDAANPNARAGI